MSAAAVLAITMATALLYSPMSLALALLLATALSATIFGVLLLIDLQHPKPAWAAAYYAGMLLLAVLVGILRLF